MPDRDTLIRFLAEAGETDRRDLAKIFGLKGGQRRELRDMIRTLEAEGALTRRGRRGYAKPGTLPPVGVVDVIDRDADGDLFVRLVKGEDDMPGIRLAPDRNETVAGAPALGDRLLVHFEHLENGEIEARLIKKLGQGGSKVLGVIRKERGEIRIMPVDRKSRDSLVLSATTRDVKDGDLVLVRPGSSLQRYGPRRCELIEAIGREDDPSAASLIAIHTHGIPTGFSEAAEAEAAAACPPTLEGRVDLRDLPFITIDPEDARDHDDAVYAHPDPEAKNVGGWIVWVAIADVAAYVPPASALDRDARDKGNSVYFPDRVEPMLPEALSAGMCSLREAENRACLAVRMVFNANGRKISHRFVRGLMRSAAKLSYEQAQAAIDGEPDDKTGPLVETLLRPLWKAYELMSKGRKERSPLSIQSSERRIIMQAGEIQSIAPRASLDAHSLIEEMMIQANVCAAETLEQRNTPLIYRIHDAPSQEKMTNLAEFLASLSLPWNKGEAARTERFNKLLADTRDGPHAEIINEVVLRTQMQAVYSPENVGHFGLNLARYAHFTSPIRRYADLIVHRALIRALNLGTDGLTDHDMVRMKATAEMITHAERRAMAAERDATDRYIAAFLADHVGAEFEGRITGVTRFGLFIRLTDTGADGLAPISGLGSEFFSHDERQHCLIGERSGARWPLGMPVTVRLIEATPVTGGLMLEVLSDPLPPDGNVRQSPRFLPRKKGGLPPGIRRGKRR